MLSSVVRRGPRLRYNIGGVSRCAWCSPCSTNLEKQSCSLSTTSSSKKSNDNNKLFSKVLIANRGEIACRILRTCQRLSIPTVTLHSSADRHAVHATLSDESYLIGTGPEAAKSYLDAQAVLDIAHQSGAQAIHPGYGFLSENANFAQLCQDQNTTFVGPSAEAIQAMGCKSTSKTIMQAARVPCTPGYEEHENTITPPQQLLDQVIEQVGFPCLIKATRGGGGKGMRLVHTPEKFIPALESCRSEALSSFANANVIVERYLHNPRHIEVQIMADQHGNVVHMGVERDCSVQRRHQKILEESPAPFLTHHLRHKMGEVAVQAAKAVGYVGAGTVEFLMETPPSSHNNQNNVHDLDGDFYFCEMNTRLQVEHPVTELVTGIDLVEWQLRVAAGQTLPIINQEEINDLARGHAMEARVYAENPKKNFLPSTGTLLWHSLPTALDTTTNNNNHKNNNTSSTTNHKNPQTTPIQPTIRVDTGVTQNSTISVYYDPMISKVLAHGPTRESTITTLFQALQQYQMVGVETNVQFLLQCLHHEAFQRGGVTTHFLEEYKDDFVSSSAGFEDEGVSSLARVVSGWVVLLAMEGRKTRGGDCSSIPEKDLKRRQGPWSNLSGSWRLGSLFQRELHFQHAQDMDGQDGMMPVTVVSNRDGSFTFTLPTTDHHDETTHHNENNDDNTKESFHIEGTYHHTTNQFSAIINKTRRIQGTAVLEQPHSDNSTTKVHLWSSNPSGLGHAQEYHTVTTLHTRPPSSKHAADMDSASMSGSMAVKAPMPGKVVRIQKQAGDEVKVGETLVVVEAMKMEHAIVAPKDGVVGEVQCVVGEVVEDGAVLTVVE